MRAPRTLGRACVCAREGRPQRERDGGANYYHLASSYRITHCRRARDHAPAAPRGSLRSCDALYRVCTSIDIRTAAATVADAPRATLLAALRSRGCSATAFAPLGSSAAAVQHATVKCVRTVTRTLPRRAYLQVYCQVSQ